MLTVPPGTADVLLADSARRHPDRAALHTPAGSLSFAELEGRVDAWAGRFASGLGRRGVRIAVSSVLHQDFPVGYYAVLRSGNTVVPLNPLLPDPALRHLLAAARVAVALVGPGLADRIDRLRAELPLLEQVLVIGEGAGGAEPAIRRIMAAASTVPDPADLAAVTFTSGTTGPAKAVALGHRAIKACAAQFALAHRVDADSTLLAHLPIFSPLHLNAAVGAGAAQILAPGPLPGSAAEAVEPADRHGATHYYALPVTLARFAADPGLGAVKFRTVRQIAAGNATLPAPVVRALTEQFGVPVFQGYGLTEAAYLLHSDGPRAPRPGSAGPVLAGTRSQVVDLVTRQPLPPGNPGELLVQGPQLMLGYLDRPDLAPFDADGWFATGDVVRLDEDGYLFVLDRVADVFHRAGELVCPSELERALLAHPAVRDAAVVDGPGAEGPAGEGSAAEGSDACRVPMAFVVPQESGADGPDAALAEVLAEVNAGLPPAQRIAHAEPLAAIPRRPTNGKVDRAALRAEMRARTDHLHEQLLQFYARQAQAVDDGDLDGYGATFHPEAEFGATGAPQPLRGRAAIVEHSRARRAERAATGQVNRHLISGLTVRRHPDGRLTTEAHTLIIATVPGERPRTLAGALLSDELVWQGAQAAQAAQGTGGAQSGGWQVARRRITPESA
ncbi:AMP-binding protein [Kitasatospora sp. NBC_01287]|uniref:AMP-binding protein n=1 Tax=Kitasatospora sp. NBC_01287 TaxID=2903573 RepID=UPI00224EF204|nr:AMP-binding protein [Kitasatospora sp. NBC_01287]MCX4748900.1 AMP-binding protein [Kitasatospora sp. NBC_01287]